MSTNYLVDFEQNPDLDQFIDQIGDIVYNRGQSYRKENSSLDFLNKKANDLSIVMLSFFIGQKIMWYKEGKLNSDENFNKMMSLTIDFVNDLLEQLDV